MNIIRYHKEKEFKLIKEKNLMDFVRIQYGRERDVMDTWEKHLSTVLTDFSPGAGVPFGIETRGKETILWKERRA